LCVKALYTKIDDLVFNGDAYAFTAALGCGSVDETIASIADIASQDYFNVAYKLSKAKRNGAKFYMSPELLARSINLKHGDTYDKLIVNVKIAGVWDIEEVDAIAGVDSTATDVALFGSLQNYALGIRTLSDSIQLNPWGSDQFKQHQVLFGFFVRLAGAPVFTDHFVNMVTA
jgi:HK97 family phage major capsid protein